MGDLSGADAALPRRRAATSTGPDLMEGVAVASGAGTGGEVGMKSCVSRETLVASDGGDTDYADHTASEVRQS